MGKMFGIIPARSGSKGVPGKNIKKLGGIPLIEWSIKAALKSKLTNVILDSDSSYYLSLFENYNISLYQRPLNLAKDDTLTSDVINNLIEVYNIEDNDVIVLLQPTCPFRDKNSINKALALLEKKADASVISVVECDAYHPLRMKRVVNDELINYVDTGIEDMRPRQKLPPVYIRSGSIYASRAGTYKRYGGFGSAVQLPIFDDPLISVNIDTPLDFLLAEHILREYEEELCL
jgi:CMP-N,N'-diacetyllegionaminic acid synthase